MKKFYDLGGGGGGGVILTSLTSHGSMLLLECKLHYIPMVYYRTFK